MTTQNLTQLTQQVRDKYASLRSFILSTQQISLTETGLLNTGKNEFALSREASEQFARFLRIPGDFYLTLESDLRALIFNRRFKAKAVEGCIGPDIRIMLNQDHHIIGYDDPKLLKISPVALMETINSSLPKGLSAQQVEISRLHPTPTTLSFSCYSPQIESQPRVGDIVNGGIDVHHSTSGEFGTQIRCYLRRRICSNGACTHICEDQKNVRVRRLPNGNFDEGDVIQQISRLLTQAWAQLDAKLQAIKGLLNKGGLSIDFLRQQRTRFSLNNRILREIEIAMHQDELGPTHTQYDLFNAISRVASHDDSLSLRQQRRMMFMAGEFSQQNVHRCSHCGSWLVTQN